MLSELLDEIENRLRLIVREEIAMALSNSEQTPVKLEKSFQQKKESLTDEKDFPQLLTAPQVAELLGIRVGRVYELTRQRISNGFPVITLGERSYRYSKKAVKEWLEKISDLR